MLFPKHGLEGPLVYLAHAAWSGQPSGGESAPLPHWQHPAPAEGCTQAQTMPEAPPMSCSQTLCQAASTQKLEELCLVSRAA